MAQRRRGKCHVAIIFLGFGRSQRQTWKSTFQTVKKSDCTQNAMASYRKSYASSGEMEVYDNVQSVKLQEWRISELGVELCTAWSHCECSAGRSEDSLTGEPSATKVCLLQTKAICPEATQQCYFLHIVSGGKISLGNMRAVPKRDVHPDVGSM